MPITDASVIQRLNEFAKPTKDHPVRWWRKVGFGPDRGSIAMNGVVYLDNATIDGISKKHPSFMAVFTVVHEYGHILDSANTYHNTYNEEVSATTHATRILLAHGYTKEFLKKQYLDWAEAVKGYVDTRPGGHTDTYQEMLDNAKNVETH